MIVHLYIGIAIFFIIGYVLIKYLNEDFKYEDKVIEEGDIRNSFNNQIKGKYYII